MKAEEFRANHPSAKQKEIVCYALNQLRTSKVVKHPCDSYESAKIFARMAQQFDCDRLCAIINVHGNYVELIQNGKGNFGFASVVVDFYRKRLKL